MKRNEEENCVKGKLISPSNEILSIHFYDKKQLRNEINLSNILRRLHKFHVQENRLLKQ